MARIKKDKTSWHASSVIRRDFRSSKEPPEVTGSARQKKNRSKWCKGKVGIEHNYVDVPFEQQKYKNISRCKEIWCEKCHRRRYEWLPLS